MTLKRKSAVFQCPQCGTMIYGTTNTFCDDECRDLDRKQRNLERYVTPLGYNGNMIVVEDPDEYGFKKGASLNNEQIQAGLQLGAFTEGMIVENNKSHHKYALIDGEMVSV